MVRRLSLLVYLISIVSEIGFTKTTIDFKRDTVLLYLPVKETYLNTSLSLNQFAQLDNLVSPLVYKGTGAGVSIGLQKRKKKNYTSISALYSNSKLYNEIQPSQYFIDLAHVNVNIVSCYEFSKFEQKKTKLLVGWQIAYLSDFRRNPQLQNSSLSYNMSTTLSPVIRIEQWLTIKENENRKLFKKGRSMRLSYQLAPSLFSGVSRPPFNAIRTIHDGSGKPYDNSVTQEVFTNYNLYSAKHFIAIHSSLAFEYFIKNGTRLSLQYVWNFEHFNKVNASYKVGQSLIQLSLQTRIN